MGLCCCKGHFGSEKLSSKDAARAAALSIEPVVLVIEEMELTECSRVEETLSAFCGVLSCTVDPEAGTATVVGTVSEAALIAAVFASTGKRVQNKRDSEDASDIPGSESRAAPSMSIARIRLSDVALQCSGRCLDFEPEADGGVAVQAAEGIEGTTVKGVEDTERVQYDPSADGTDVEDAAAGTEDSVRPSEVSGGLTAAGNEEG